MLRAAELWAQARRRGRPTADPKELDCDVILAEFSSRGEAQIALQQLAAGEVRTVGYERRPGLP